ncbi:MAG: tRNA epoxyqueuosine(34) reductase QueG [Myxococcota bacterium]
MTTTEATPEERSARVKALALEEGFDLAGVATPDAAEAWSRYREAMGRGYGADMAWLTDNPDVRRDVREVHPPARSVVVLGVSYASDVPGYLAEPPGPERGWIARYAQGKDYHHVVRKMLIRLAKRFAADPLLGHDSRAHRVFTDTGPVLEKDFARRAGLGWIGKNTLLIHRPGGSWYFLGVVLTPLDLAVDRPETDHCGTCRRCLDACPTDAFPEPYVLDARRCISYWTIESHDPVRHADPETLGQHVFGCDICQEVCPWNRKAVPSRHASLRPRQDNVRPRLADLAELDDDAFRERFPRSPVRRTDAARMRSVVDLIRRRNARQEDAEGRPDGDT